jgi:CDP-6-deoxy-D-xylo-4-hexulose-3-dehydrase
MKITDMQAAVGVAQLRKLPDFIVARKRNWDLLYDGLKPLEKFLVLPRATASSEPSWFGFPITVRPEAFFTRDQLVRFLESRKVATRQLFAGNLTRQPAFQKVRYRAVGRLENTDTVMKRTFWVGVYPGLSEEMIRYVISTMRAFVLS